MNWKMIIAGAGILLIWGFIGAAIGFLSVPWMLWVAVGLLPSWYVGKQYAIAGYLTMFIVLWFAQPGLFPGGA